VSGVRIKLGLPASNFSKKFIREVEFGATNLRKVEEIFRCRPRK
jgi:hypothetical protein